MTRAGAPLLGILLLTAPLAGCLTSSGWAQDMAGVGGLASRGLTGKGVKLAIIDTGIEAGHPQFKGLRIEWADLVNGQAQPYDDNGHGTHIAGIIVARGDFFSELIHGVSVKGIAPGVSLVVLKAIRANGEGSDDLVADAVDTAVAHGADIVLMSLGGAKGLLLGTQTENAAKRAIGAGVYVVAAAGNRNGEEEMEDVASPASVDDVIAVGAVDRSRRVAAFSQHGSNDGTLGVVGARSDPDRKPEVVAPGVGIISTWRADGYATAEGTSQAAPFVAAVLALILEARPDLQRGSGAGTLSQVKDALMRSSEKIGPLAGKGETAHEDGYGYGLLRADGWLARLGG